MSTNPPTPPTAPPAAPPAPPASPHDGSFTTLLTNNGGLAQRQRGPWVLWTSGAGHAYFLHEESSDLVPSSAVIRAFRQEESR